MAGHYGEVQRLFQERENKESLGATPEPSIAPCSGARIVG